MKTAVGVLLTGATFVVPISLVIFGPSEWGFSETVWAFLISGGVLAFTAGGFLSSAEGDRQQIVTERVARESHTDGELISGGAYSVGHPSIAAPTEVAIGSNASDFVIVQNWDGQRLATIPRAGLLDLSITDETHVETHHHQRLTATRLAVMGPFALAAPKRTTTTEVRPRFVLHVRWQESSFSHDTQFIFGAAETANAALAFFHRKVLPRSV